MYIVVENNKLSGFISEDINPDFFNQKEKIIKEITYDLWLDLMIGTFKVNTEALLSIDKNILNIEDKDLIFTEEIIEPENIKDKADVLLEEVSKTKIELMQVQNLNKTLLEHSAKDKLLLMQQQSLNKEIIAQAAKDRLSFMDHQKTTKSVLEELAKSKITNIQQQEINKSLLKEIASLKLAIMKGGN